MMVSNSPLEVMLVISSVFSPSVVLQLVPHSELVYMYGWWLMVMDLESNSAVKLEAMVKISSEAEIYFPVKYERSDWSHFLLHMRRIRKGVSLGGLTLLLEYLQVLVGDNLQLLSSGKIKPLGCIVVYQWYIKFQLQACNTTWIYNGHLMYKYTNPVCHDDPMTCNWQVCCKLSH